MNKLIAIGDIHGRQIWKQIVTNNQFDKVVFIGDYFDTHENINAAQQIDNFKDIIAFKEANMDKVVLLLGNHDYHYLSAANETYSGFQEWHKTEIKELLDSAISKGYIQMCYHHDKFLFSHAGVTNTWCKDNDIDMENLCESINKRFIEIPESFRFAVGRNMSPYGDDVTQSPIWVRPHSLLQDHVPNYIYVVGHTTQPKLAFANDVIVLIDTLGTSKEYFVVEGDKFDSAIAE
jgi:hypothetical protein